MRVPDHLTCLLRNLYSGQEATVGTKRGTMDWFQTGKGVCQGCILSPCLFNLYTGYIMQNARLDESQAEIKIAKRNINNLRYADDNTLIAESEKELKGILKSRDITLPTKVHLVKAMVFPVVMHGCEFTSVQSVSHVQLFATSWTAACQASLSIANSRSLPKLMSIELVMPYNHLIFCHPLLLLPSVFPSIRVFSNDSALHIRWLKDWSFSFNISPFNEHPGLMVRVGV